MSTALADPVAMIRKGAPHLIHSDEQLECYTEALFQLTAKARRTAAEEEAIALLTLLVERMSVSATRYPTPRQLRYYVSCSITMTLSSAILRRS